MGFWVENMEMKTVELFSGGFICMHEQCFFLGILCGEDGMVANWIKGLFFAKSWIFKTRSFRMMAKCIKVVGNC